MDKSVGDYKAEILQAVAKSHERMRDYNERVRTSMKTAYDKTNKVGEILILKPAIVST